MSGLTAREMYVAAAGAFLGLVAAQLRVLLDATYGSMAAVIPLLAVVALLVAARIASAKVERIEGLEGDA